MVRLGILLSERHFDRLLQRGAPLQHYLALDHERRLGVKTLMLPVSSIDLDGERTRAAVATREGWLMVDAEPPPLIYHNLLTYSTKPEAKALRTLNGDLRVVVFNETNRWNRGLVFEVLARAPDLQHVIPPTVPLEPHDLDFLQSGPGPFVLAATQGNLGHGALLLQRKGADLVEFRDLRQRTSGRWSLDVPGGFTATWAWIWLLIRHAGSGCLR